jgi:hypothetical protein
MLKMSEKCLMDFRSLFLMLQNNLGKWKRQSMNYKRIPKMTICQKLYRKLYEIIRNSSLWEATCMQLTMDYK